MKIVAIIQARMGSTRLPGKVLQEIADCTMLELVVRRTQKSRLIDEVVVATTTKSADSAIVAECNRLSVPVFCGSEDDVLDRYYQVAKAHSADYIVRITSDCPLIDPAVVDYIIAAFKSTYPTVDYASNSIQRTYPRGLDTEIMSWTALNDTWKNASEVYQRVHVTPYLYKNADKFALLPVTNQVDYSGWRWTVDTPDDLEFVREVYKQAGNNSNVDWKTVVTLIEANADLVKINQHIQQKALYEG